MTYPTVEFTAICELKSTIHGAKQRRFAIGSWLTWLFGALLICQAIALTAAHAQTPTPNRTLAAKPMLVAQIQKIRGEVTLVKPNSPQSPVFATTGMEVPVGSLIRTGPRSNVTLAIVQKLPLSLSKTTNSGTASLPVPEPIVHAQATLTSQSTVLLSSIADTRGEPKVVIELQNGYLQSRVGEQLRNLLSPANAKREPYQVRTRMATIGVRGTYFGVSNNPTRATVTTSLLQGKVTLSTPQEAINANSKASSSPDMAVALEPDFGAVIKDTPNAKASVQVQALPAAPTWIADGYILDTAERSSLRWKTVSEADRYVVELSNDAAFTDIVSQTEVDSKNLQTADDGGAVNLFYTQHFDALPRGIYHVRVAAKTEDGLIGRFATTLFQRRQYDIQTGQQVDAKQGEQLLYWTALPEAKYRITISKNLNTDTPVLQINGLTHNFVQLSNLPAGQYQWKVQAYIAHPSHNNIEVQSTPMSLQVAP